MVVVSSRLDSDACWSSNVSGAFKRLAVVGILAVLMGLTARPYVEDRILTAFSPGIIAPRGSLAEIERSTIELFERVSPSVVEITTITIGDDSSNTQSLES